MSANYPVLINGGFNVNDLIYDAGDVTLIENAWIAVIDYALSDFAANLMLAAPNYQVFSEMKPTGVFEIGFYVTHNPSGFYAGLDIDDVNIDFAYHADNSTPIIGADILSNGVTALSTANYNANCGLIQTFYLSIVTKISGFTEPRWKTLELNPNIATQAILINQTGSIECEEPCPTSNEICTTICDTINVNVVSIVPNSCPVQNKAYNDVLIGQTKIYPANTVYSISVLQTSGEFKYRFDNNDFVEITGTSNYNFQITSNTNCEFLQSSLTVDATDGGVIVLVQY